MGRPSQIEGYPPVRVGGNCVQEQMPKGTVLRAVRSCTERRGGGLDSEIPPENRGVYGESSRGVRRGDSRIPVTCIGRGLATKTWESRNLEYVSDLDFPVIRKRP
jgi:hypothetical protein